MSVYERAARVWLKSVIDALNSERRLLLKDVAARAEISVPTLRKAHRQFDTSVTDATLRALEHAYGLGHLELDVVLATPGYWPQPAVRPLAPDASGADEVCRFLAEFAAAQPAEFSKVCAEIDALCAQAPR